VPAPRETTNVIVERPLSTPAGQVMPDRYFQS
jgi:hypothetical protein